MSLVHGQIPAGRWRHIFAVLLILLAQLATVVHASEHEFHEHTEACDIYQHAENQQGNGLATAALVLDTSQQALQLQPVVDSPVSTTARHFHQRAPPLS
jgi:hypothetical protein